jgi:hypothetical protein
MYKIDVAKRLGSNLGQVFLVLTFNLIHSVAINQLVEIPPS